MVFDQTTETFDPFEEKKEVKISYRDWFTKYEMATKMSEGIIERASESNFNTEDIDFLKWLVNRHTNWDLATAICTGDSVEIAYVVDLVLSTVLDNERREWEEFVKNNTESFINKETLGINNDY